MDLYYKINTTAFYIGKTYQEAVDIYANSKGYYYFRNLPEQKGLDLSYAEGLILRVHQISKRSDLFIFHGYRFEFSNSQSNNIRVRAISLQENLPSLGKSLIQGSFVRLIKGIVIIAVGIFTCPIWTIILTGATIYDFGQLKGQILNGFVNGVHSAGVNLTNFSIFNDVPNSHFTAEDIVHIGGAKLGYRHVSTEEHAQSDAMDGIDYGCALNISFGPSEHRDEEELFKDLDKRVTNGEDCNELIKKYNDAITEFIMNAMSMDLRTREASEGFTYLDFISTIDTTRFMLTKPRYMATDMPNYWGLGRFPKETILSQNVHLLRRCTLEDLDISESDYDRTIITSNEFDLLKKYIASHYRKILLETIRTASFDCKQPLSSSWQSSEKRAS